MKAAGITYKGINTDASYETIQEGFYIDALDVRISTDKGESMGAVTNIKGNSLYFQLPTTDPDLTIDGQLEIIGATSIRQEIIIFVADDSNTNGWIFKFTYDDIDKSFLGLNLVYKNAALNFSKLNPIEAIGRFENVNIKRIYFTDYNNPLRVINIEDPTLATTPVGLLDTFPDITYKLPLLTKVLTGGSLRSGLWQYAYRLVTFDGKETLISPPSNLIHTTDSLETLTQSAQYVGDFSNQDTGKAHEITIDTSEYSDFETIDLIAIYHQDTITTAQVFFIESKAIAGQASITFTHTGDEDTIFPLDITTYTIKQYPFKTVKSLTAKDNSLVVANIKEGSFSIQDLLPSGETFDAKTKRFLNDGVTLPSADALTNAFNVDYNKDAHWDVNWHTSKQYKYKSDGQTLGGDGPNVSYKFHLEPFVIDADSQPGFANLSNTPVNPVDLNDGYGNYANTTYDSMASPFKSGLLKGYKRGETYRFGVVFYNKKGEASFVEYIGDIKFPDISDETLENTTGFYSQNYFPLSVETARNAPASITTTAFALGVEFTLDFTSCPSLLTQIESFQIVRVKREDNDTRRLCSGIMRMAASYPSGPAAASSFDLRGPGGDTNIVHLFGQQQNRSAVGVAASPGFGSNGNFYTINSLHMVGNNFPIAGIFGSYYSPELSYDYLNTVADALNNSYLLMTGRYGQYYSKLDILDPNAANSYMNDITDNTSNDFYSLRVRENIDTAGTEDLGRVIDITRKMRSTGKVDKISSYPANIFVPLGYLQFEKGVEYIRKWQDVKEIRFDENQQTTEVLDRQLSEAIGPYTPPGGYFRNFCINVNDGSNLNNSKDVAASINKGASGITGAMGRVDIDPLDGTALTKGSPSPPWRATDYYAGGGGELLINSVPDSAGPLAGGIKPQDLISTPIIDLMLPKLEVYGGYTQDALEANIFMPASPVIDKDIIIGTSHTFRVYGGDIFIGMWTFQGMTASMDQRFFDGTAEEFFNNYTETIAIPIETKINLALDYGATLKRGVRYDAIGGASGIKETRWRQETDNYDTTYGKSLNMYGYNSAYSLESDELVFVVKPNSLDSSIGITNDIRSYISNVKINGELVDSWTQFGINNYYDVDDYGPINKVINFNDEVFFVQDRGVGRYSINPRAIVSVGDGIPTELGSGQGFQDHSYISNTHGSIHQWAVKATNYGIYFWDAIHAKIFRVGGQGAEPITEITGVHSLVNSFNGACELRKENGGDNPIINKGVLITKDKINDEVLFTFLGTDKDKVEPENVTLVYDELMQTFSSKFSATPPVYIENGDVLFTVNNSSRGDIYQHNVGNWGEFYGVQEEMSIKLVLNADSMVNKILRTVEFNSIVRDDNKTIDRTQTITAFRVQTEYQDTDKILYSADRVKRKFDKWRLKIPRDVLNGSTDRLRSSHFILTLYFDNTYNKELILNRLLYYYDIQIF
jgi:hypothetical protein